MSSPTVLRRSDQVVFAGLDTSRLSIAIDVLRGEALGDGHGVRNVVSTSSKPHEVFASLLALLLLQARTAGDALNLPGHEPVGPARYLSLLAVVEKDPAESLLLHQVSMSLRQNPDTDRVCLSPVSVSTLARVCTSVARDLAARDGQDLSDHVEALSSALDTFHSRSTK